MKKAKKPETNEEIRKRLSMFSLDGSNQDAIYILKIGMGFEPLDDLDYILKVLEERKQHKNNK